MSITTSPTSFNSNGDDVILKLLFFINASLDRKKIQLNWRQQVRIRGSASQPKVATFHHMYLNSQCQCPSLETKTVLSMMNRPQRKRPGSTVFLASS